MHCKGVIIPPFALIKKGLICMQENKEDKLTQTINLVNDVKNDATKKVKAYAKPKYISAMFEIVISVMMIAGIQIVKFGFDINCWKDWTFWMNIVCTSIGVFTLYRAVVNSRFEKTANRQSVVDIRTKYNELNKQKDLEMKTWLKDYNLRTKTETYIDMQNQKILKIEMKLIKCFNPKRKAKLEAKLEALKKTIETDYIASIITTIHIKYYIVFYSDFTDNESSDGKGGTITRGNYNLEFNKSSFKKMWLYIISAILFGVSIISQGDQSTFELVTTIFMALFMSITRIVTALLEADGIYDRTITRSLTGRIDVLEEYIKYKNNHPQPTEIEKARQEALEQAQAEYEKKLELETKRIQQECINLIETGKGA